MPIQPGNHLGPYEIVAAIGAGGMGEVYRARDAKLGRDVALKVLPEGFARDAERMARFQREAKVLASLNHPNIASIYGLEDSGATHALVMELVEGPTLADRIKQGPIPIDEALKIAKQICDALEYAHERGIVHRDLKPANIKISREDTVKVLDFGLAKALDKDASSMDISSSPTMSRMATMQGVLLGTAAYMSPEQAKGKAVDRRADIWAFGCVLYEMLTGKMAFSGETVTDTLAAVVMKDPDWSQLPASTPARVRALLQRCLQKDAKQRLRDIGEARIAIDEVLSGAPEASSSALTAAPAAAPFWRRALPWAVAFAVAIAFATLALVQSDEKAALPTRVMRFEIPLPPKVTLTGDDEFALSPDGSQLAFYAEGADGVPRIWVRPLASVTARPLSGTENSPGPFFWSADSTHIAWGGSGKLKAIDVSSGAIETVWDTPSVVVGGSWNRDGMIIFGRPRGSVVMRVPASGGTASPITQMAGVFPSFLPEGRHFIYVGYSAKQGSTGIYLGSLDAQPGEQSLTRLLATNFEAEYVPSSDPNSGQMLYLSNDGALMAQPFDVRRLKLTGAAVPVAQHVGSFRDYGFFSAAGSRTLIYREGGGPYQLTWFDGHGEVVGTARQPGLYGPPALSPDGSRAIIVGPDSQGNETLWMSDFSRDTTTRFTFGSGARYPAWSGDGKRVVFASNSSGTYDLYEKPANGAMGEQLLLKSNEDKSPTDVSADGRFLLYDSADPKTGHDIWVLPLQGDQKPFPFLRTQFYETDAHFSPDRRWVAYVSNESGRNEVYVRPFSADSSATNASGAGAKWQVSYGGDGGGEPRWSADGKKLYFLDNSMVMEADVTTSPTFQAGTPKALFEVPQQPGESVGDYTVDGKRFLFLAPAGEAAQAPFNVVLNWQAALKKSQ